MESKQEIGSLSFVQVETNNPCMIAIQGLSNVEIRISAKQNSVYTAESVSLPDSYSLTFLNFGFRI